MAIKTNGTLWAWGWNNPAFFVNNGVDYLYIPTQIGNDTDWKTIKTGLYHAIALKADNTLWSWGSNSYGQLASGAYTHIYPPTQINNENNWKALACGDLFTLAINTDGNLWTSGNNTSGQLGDGTTINKTNLTEVDCTTLDLNNLQYKTIAVFPNPAQDYIYISNEINIEKIVIINVLGKLVFETTKDVFKINVESFQSGIYIMNIYYTDKTYNIKFIKD